MRAPVIVGVPIVGDEAHVSSLEQRTQAFLREFFAKGEELVRELIEENERLRSAVHPARGATSQQSSDATEVLVGRLLRQVEHLEVECAEIRRLAGSMELESGGYRQRLDALEKEHYHLASMYVVGNQFHGAMTVDEVLRTITEILLNFVGVGRFTVYLADEERQSLFPVWREGGALDDCPELSLSSDGPVASVMGASGSWKAQVDDVCARAGTCSYVPLVSGTRLVGLTRIERLLPQKSELTEEDVGLLELVSEHAGIAIETAWIRAHAAEMPFARGALERLVVA